MKVYMKYNVWEAANERINRLFDEFPEVVVGISGGKDSTIVYNLALNIARERNRLPLKVLFLDQEAEWNSTIEHVRYIMYNPDVKPMWFQMPMKIFNATSYTDQWLYCWREGSNWLRDKEPISIKENIYGTDRFTELFTNIFEVEFGHTKACYIAGVRGEESPTRVLATTQSLAYKDITWGKRLNSKLQHFTFYPIYDWKYSDVWKAIHDNNWRYCALYDYMYSYGVSIPNMRVSNINHETAIRSLYYMQEIEPETWNKMLSRLSGVSSAQHLGSNIFEISSLPYMFKSWGEYRDYLLDNLVTDKTTHSKFADKFAKLDNLYDTPLINKAMNRVCISAILKNDYHMTTIGNFERSPDINTYRKVKTGKIKTYEVLSNNNYIKELP